MGGGWLAGLFMAAASLEPMAARRHEHTCKHQRIDHHIEIKLLGGGVPETTYRLGARPTTTTTQIFSDYF